MASMVSREGKRREEKLRHFWGIECLLPVGFTSISDARSISFNVSAVDRMGLRRLGDSVKTSL